MNRIRVLIAIVGLSMAAFLVAQTSSTSSSTSRSGGGQATATSSSSGFARGTGSKSSGASSGGSSFGFQGKPTHAIFLSPDRESRSDIANNQALQQEAKYMSDQQAKGKVLLFGPWRDQPGSMAIVLAQSDAEAEQIAKNDPAVRSGNMSYEVRAWSVR